MNVPVVLERVKDNGYRATAFAQSPLVAEASTREQAVEKVREMIRERLSGVEVIQVEVSGPTRPVAPWLAASGIWHDHPDAAELEQNLSDYRDEVDADQGRL